ncbi:MAG: hypothetical protein GY947_09935 [Rhodobacteraceae bacterium]|nr:hypothetical protein [Paracoccaceae bacterium]
MRAGDAAMPAINKEKLVAQIKSAFLDTTPPEMPEYLKKYSSDINQSNFEEALEETEEFWGKHWQELTCDHYDRNWCVFYFLTAEAVPYFFGAFMVHSIGGDRFDFDVFDSFLPADPFGRIPNSKEDRKYRKSRNALTTKPFCQTQLSVIADYFQFALEVTQKGHQDPQYADQTFSDALKLFRTAAQVDESF